MGDYFENDIDRLDDEDFADLEDHEVQDTEDSTEDFVYPDRLFRLKLEYSCEGLYATAPERMELCGGDYVIIPTKYGKDYARVMGPVSQPVGIKPSDIIAIDRKANQEDMVKAASLKEKEGSAFKIEADCCSLSFGRAEGAVLFQCRQAGRLPGIGKGLGVCFQDAY